MNSEKTSISFSELVTRDQFIDLFLEQMVPAVEESAKPSKLLVEVHNESEYGEDLPGHALFEIAEKRFREENKELAFDSCNLWKLNEYVVIMGVRK